MIAMTMRMAAASPATCEHCGADVGLLGKVVGDRYLIVERLGRGGAGTIYLAEHITVKRRVAVKVIHPELARDELAIERFRREATTVAEIDTSTSSRCSTSAGSATGDCSW